MNTAGKTILLVEDEAIIALSTRRQLERAGYVVAHSPTGESAIEFVNGNPDGADLILMDIDLGPGIDGAKAAEEILRTHEIPIIFLSSRMESEIVLKTEAITNYGYVVKPSSSALLYASIKTAFRLFFMKKQLALQGIEVKSSNEELRKDLDLIKTTCEDLALRKTMAEQIFRLSPDAISVTRASAGVYIDINDSFSRLFGYSRGETLGRSCRDGDLGIWVNEDERVKLLERFRKSGDGIKFETEFRHKDGSLITASASAHLISLGGEDCVISSMREIAVDRRRERELAESEDRYRMLFEEAGAGILIYDGNLKILEANEKTVEMFAYSKDELRSMSLFDLDPDLADPRTLMDRTKGILALGPYAFSAKRRRKDGVILSVEVNAMPIAWRGKPAVMAIVHDSSERIERERENDRTQSTLRAALTTSEIELLEKESLLTTIGDNVPAAVAIVDVGSFSYQYVNKGYETIIGRLKDCLIGVPMEEIIGKSEYRSLSAFVEKVKHGGSVSFERIISTPTGERWAHENWIPLLDDLGKVERILLLNIDINEMKETTEALKRSEERFRLAMDAAEEVIWDYDIKAGEIYYSPAFHQLYGYTAQEIGEPGRHIDYVHPDDRASFRKAFVSCIENGDDNVELDYRLMRKSVGWRWLSARSKVISRTEDGMAERMVGTIVDISDRKSDEEKIRALSRELQMILDTAPVGIAKIADDRFDWINKAISDLLCYSSEELYGREVSMVFPSVEAFNTACGKMINSVAKNNEPFQFTLELLRGDGQHSTFYLSGNAIDSSDPSKGIILAGEDITRQKRLEEKLVASESKYRALFKAVSDAICIIDRKSGAILDCNEATERLLRRTREELIGIDFMSTSLHPDTSQLGEIINRDLIPLRYHRRKDGASIPLEIAVSHLRLDGRDMIVAAMRDISLRIESEEKIRKLLQEKEIILQEVHHRIKNNLSVLSSILSIRVANSGDEKANSFLNEAICEIDAMSLLYDKLYRSAYTGEIPLNMYLPELLSQAISVFGEDRKPEVVLEIDDISLDAALLSRLGIIINELVTNSMKYAFSGVRNPTISLQAFRQGFAVHLKYADNGVGLPDSFRMGRSNGFGMQLILAMMEQIRGKLMAENRGGATFCIEFDI